MSRPVSAVHVDIARFVLEVSRLSADSAESTEKLRGAWVTRLAEALAMRDPSMHPYGAYLLSEVEEYRKAETERKRAKFSALSALSADSADSADSQPRTDQNRSEQSNKEEKKGRKPSASPGPLPVTRKPKEEFFPDAIPMMAAKFFWESYVKEWSPQAKEPTAAGFQAWARDIDLMFRVDKRTPEAFNELLDWIDRQPPSKSGFTWRKNVLSPATLRQRWNEGKFADFLPSELRKEEFR